MRSLRFRLFVLIVVPLIAVAAFAGVARYVLAERMSRDLYDNTLLTVALAISRDVVLSEGDMLSEDLLRSLTTALGDRIHYRVEGPDRSFITGYSTPPPMRAEPASLDDTPQFYDSMHFGEPVRVVVIREYISEPVIGGWVTLHVWQTVRQRESLSILLVGQAAALMAIVIAAAGICVWFGINFGLKPLTDLQDAVERRSQDDLGPIQRRVPREVKSLVSALNDLFRRLSDAFAARDAFISNAAHQLRNPIAAIRAQAEAAEAAPQSADLRHRISDLADAARGASRLTQQLLSLERARGRDVSTTAETFDLERLAADVLGGKAAEGLRRGTDVSFVPYGGPLPVIGDPVMMGEAIENLLDNAFRYGGSAVQVITSREGGFARLAVEDDGPGVGPEAREVIFERFRRGVADSGNGSGLGLAIVREVADAHGGSVRLAEVAIEAAGGARFELDLPLAPGARVAATAAAADAA